MGGLAQATRGWLESGGVPAPNIIATSVPSQNVVVLQWSQPITLTVFGASLAAWTITPPPGDGPVTVTQVQLIDPTHVQLTTTDQADGASYQLNVAQGAVQNANNVPNFATATFFTGQNAPLTISSHKLVDGTDLIITFSRAVQQSTASVPGNYVFSPALQVQRADRITDSQYVVRTSPMKPNTLYTVTVSNVRALDGSPI